jgi:hypothetical protein
MTPEQTSGALCVSASDNHDRPSQVLIQFADSLCADGLRTAVVEIDVALDMSTEYIEANHCRTTRVLQHERIQIGFRVKVKAGDHQGGPFDWRERAKASRLHPGPSRHGDGTAKCEPPKPPRFIQWSIHQSFCQSS